MADVTSEGTWHQVEELVADEHDTHIDEHEAHADEGHTAPALPAPAGPASSDARAVPPSSPPRNAISISRSG